MFCRNETTRESTLCGQNATFLNLREVAHVVTSVFERVERLCPHLCAFIFLLRFHLSTLPFGACHRRMPQPVLTCAPVDVQLVTSVDGNSMEVSDAALSAGISAAFIALKNVRKKTRKIPAIDMG